LGAAAYLDVIVQAAALTDARALKAEHRRQLAASVSLFRALGGGWEEKDRALGSARASEPSGY